MKAPQLRQNHSSCSSRSLARQPPPPHLSELPSREARHSAKTGSDDWDNALYVCHGDPAFYRPTTSKRSLGWLSSAPDAESDSVRTHAENPRSGADAWASASERRPLKSATSRRDLIASSFRNTGERIHCNAATLWQPWMVRECNA